MIRKVESTFRVFIKKLRNTMNPKDREKLRHGELHQFLCAVFHTKNALTRKINGYRLELIEKETTKQHSK